MNKKIKLIKDVIKLVKKEYGVEMCKEFAVGCMNCEGQILLGHLNSLLDTIEYDIKMSKAFDKVTKKI